MPTSVFAKKFVVFTFLWGGAGVCSGVLFLS